MNIMEKILKINKIACFLILATLLSSCKQFLDLKPASTLNTGNAYNTADDLNNALAGAYRAFYYEYYQWDDILLGDVRSDNAYSGGGGDAPIMAYDNFTITTGNNRMYANWSQLYIGIGRCNVIISKLNDIKDPALDKNNLRKQIIGQASFLRAIHYFQLVKTYGGVPIELNSNSADPAKTNIARSTEKEVYDQIDKDLQVAVANLPDSYSTDNTENKVKATKGAANALLAKIWAQRSDRDYSKVLQYCNAVISSPAGYALLPNYADLFDGAHYLNNESILEISYLGGNWDVSNWAVQLFLAPEDGWQKYCVPSKDLVNAYDAENDNVRKTANIIFWDNIDWADENWNPCGDKSITIPFNYKQKHPDGWNSGDHFYLLRLGDILLLKAEAQNETGDLNGAASTVNQIRTRIGLPGVVASGKDAMKAKILLERRLELAFEAQRWDDLVRAGNLVQTMTSLHEVKYTCGDGVPSAAIPISYGATADKILCPIPQQELDANQNLVQNPGY